MKDIVITDRWKFSSDTPGKGTRQLAVFSHTCYFHRLPLLICQYHQINLLNFARLLHGISPCK
ncbi:hypothetical protein ASZ90_019262 [hydrocarbon metagenome]|uniref:Uncharacterized protein n=1 Tax=hydrocarbon metagenome TaxID=938273 RepID=A0A0W8E3W2_9ZZZZ